MVTNKKTFSWQDFYKDLAEIIIKKYTENKENTEKELRDIMRKGIKYNILYMDLDSKISEYGNKNIENRIDPFTFFANFNRGIKNENRKSILEDLNEYFKLGFNDIEGDYLVPVVNNQRAWFFTGALNEGDKDIDNLWKLFEKGFKGEVDDKLFDKIYGQPVIGIAKLTMGLFWINPEEYISLDKNTIYYLENKLKDNKFDFNEFNFKKYSEIISNKKLKKDGFIKIVKDAYFIIRTKPELIKKADELNNELRNVGISVMDRLKQISSILFWLYLSEQTKLIRDNLKYDSEEDYTVEKVNIIFSNIFLENSKEFKNDKIGSIFNDVKIDKNFEKYINDFIKKLDVEILSNTGKYEGDLFGDLYEYFLKTISDAGNLGEFYTPRHIVDLMVFILKQKGFNLKNDKIYDPTCGTAGFLSYIWQEFKDKGGNENNIHGNELNGDTQKFALMNMFLHGDGNSNITQGDSLDKSHIDEIKEEKIKYVIANPPYGAKGLDSKNILWENGYKDFLKKDLETKTSELLFLQQIFSVLNKGGTAGVIIPEGVNFQSGAAKNIREFLLRNCSEFEVFSLPAGAFMPYTGVKTSFYVFTKKTDENDSCRSVKFFDIKNDGYSLDKKRREISGSDILKIKENYRTKKGLELLEKEGVLYDQSIEELEKNNFSLSIKKEEKVREYKWEMVELGDDSIFTILDNLRKPLTIRNKGKYPYYGATGIMEYVDGYIFDEKLVLIGEDGAKWGANENTSFVIDGKTWVNNHAHVLRVNNEKILEEYFAFVLNYLDLYNFITGATVKKLNQENLKKIKIPLPPLEEQKKIVAKLEKLGNLGKLSRDLYEVLENIGVEDEFFESEEGDKKELLNFTNIVTGNTPSTKENTYWGNDFPWISSSYCKNKKIQLYEVEKYLTEKGLEKSILINKNTTLLALVGTTLGKVGFINFSASINQNIAGIKSKNSNILNDIYLYYYLLKISSDISKYKGDGIFSHVGYRVLTKGTLEQWKIKIPSLFYQKQIAKYFHTYFLLKDFIKVFSFDIGETDYIKFLQNKILESFLNKKDNDNLDIILNILENTFEEEKYFEEEILNKVYNKIIDLVDLDNFKIEENSEIVKSILLIEGIEQENIDQIILSLNSLKEYGNNEIFKHLKQNLETVLLQKEFNKGEIFNYELYKQIKILNKTYLDSKKLFKNGMDEDDFEQSFINFNKHLKCIFDTFSRELQTLTQPLNFKFKESKVFTELEKYSSVVLNYLADEIKQNFVFDYSKFKDNASSSKNYIISNDLETIYENINEKYYFEKKDILNYYLSLLTKQFVILYGITGIGKSKIASEFPKHIYGSEISGNYFKHIAIKAGWDDDKDIKGYYDNLEQDYREGEMLNIIKKAIIDRKNPYFVLLDEMNISKVEHYLSDFLSYIETISQKNSFISENEINLYNTEILDYLEEIKKYFEKLVIQNTFWNKDKGDEDNEIYKNLFDKPEIKKDFYKLLSIESKTGLNLIGDLLENNPIFGVNSLIWSNDDKKTLDNFIKYIKLQLGENIWEIKDGSIENYLNFIQENLENIYLGETAEVGKKIKKDLNYLVNNKNLSLIVNYVEYLSKIKESKYIFLFNTLYDFLNIVDIKGFEIKKDYNFEEIGDIVNIQFGEIIIKDDFDSILKIFDIIGKPEKLKKDDLTKDDFEVIFEKNYFEKRGKNIIADLIRKDIIISYKIENSQREEIIYNSIVLYDTKEEIEWANNIADKGKIGHKQEKVSDNILDKNTFILKLSNKNYFSDFIYLSDYNFKKSERSKLTKEEQLVDFKNKLIGKIKEGYSIKLSGSNGENKFKNILSLTLKEIEQAKFEIGVRIPDNLYITGTINIDETTEGLSPKVIDRANIIEYNQIHLNEKTEFLDFLESKAYDEEKLDLSTIKPFDFKNEAKIYDIKENIGKENLEIELINQIILLKKIYFITQEANQHFGYRTIEEILKYMWNCKTRISTDKKILTDFFDLQILQKILPKIGGYNQKTELVLRKILKELVKEKFGKNIDEINKLKKFKNEIVKTLEKYDSKNIDEIEKILAETINKSEILKLEEIREIISKNTQKTDNQNIKLVDVFIENNTSKLLLLDIIESKILELENNEEKLKIFKFNENYSFDDFNSEKKQISELDSDYEKSVKKIISMLEKYYQEGKTSYFI